MRQANGCPVHDATLYYHIASGLIWSTGRCRSAIAEPADFFYYHVRFPWIPLERDVKLSRAKSGMRANKALDTGEHACALPILDVSEAR